MAVKDRVIEPHGIERGDDYEWGEWSCSQHGVPWRTGGATLRAFERLERQGWRVFLSAGNFFVLRRKIRRRRADRA